MTAMIEISDLSKAFTLHNQSGAVIPVTASECVGLTGQSGAGKSTLIRMVYGNYLTAGGRLLVAGTDVAQAAPRDIIALRRNSLGYVSQFLRVMPRVPTMDVVAEPLLRLGVHPTKARAQVCDRLVDVAGFTPGLAA